MSIFGRNANDGDEMADGWRRYHPTRVGARQDEAGGGDTLGLGTGSACGLWARVHGCLRMLRFKV